MGLEMTVTVVGLDVVTERSTTTVPTQKPS